MKKLISIALCICLTLAVVFVAAPSFKSQAEAVDSNDVADLFTEYVEKGTYIKTTHIQTEATGEDYFHAGADQKSRITLYREGDIYMSNSEGTINSGYRNAENGVDMEHYYYKDKEPFVDYTVKGITVEDKYVDLEELKGLAQAATWESVDGSKYQMTSELTTPWVHFVAPMWIGDTDGLTVRVFTLEDLVLQLWDGENYFAQATISFHEEKAAAEEKSNSYVFSGYTPGKQYAVNEIHAFDEYVTCVTTKCHFTTELRIYASGTYDGYAVFQVEGPVSSITVNAGNKVDTLVVSGSNDDGDNWTQIGEISVTSTSYKDYTLTFGTSYKWFKLDVKGSNQVRLKNITINFTAGGGNACNHYYATETKPATCTTAGTQEETCVFCGESSPVTTLDPLGHNYVDGVCVNCEEIQPQEKTATLTFDADKANRTSFSTTQQVWSQNGITFTNNKASSTNNVADYGNPVRLYQNSAIVVEADGVITKIVFKCSSADYATVLKNSIGANATASGNDVTVVLDGTSTTYTVASLSAQVRISSIVVTYAE